MSRAVCVFDTSPPMPPTDYLLNSEYTTKFDELPDVTNKALPKLVSRIDMYYFCNNKAGTTEVTIYQIAEQLSQDLVGSMRLNYLPFYHQENKFETEKDMWVEMPPLSVEKIVLQAHDMGFGEPLAFLDTLPEEE